MAALKSGGNAVDGAVAAALTLGVVDGSNSGLGGGCFLLIRTPAGEIIGLDGRETAPAKVTSGLYLHEGRADTRLSQTGALAAGTPGALAAYELALREHGRLPLKTHLLAAAALAERGFALDARYAERLATAAPELGHFPASRAIFLHEDGTPLRAGETLRQPELAATYRAIAEHGLDWFYRGPFAEKTAAWMEAHGGVLGAGDFRAYEVQRRTPVETVYRGHRVVSFAPPSSGGLHLVQMLQMLEHFDLPRLPPADAVHVTAEAMKLAFADRAFWLGDPAFTAIPAGLTARPYTDRLAGRIHMEKTLAVETHGEPGDPPEKHTTHLSVADAEGTWVACTATINTYFGSKVVIPGTGLLLNNEMDDFSLEPGVPNAFGLVGGTANAIAPGKRPLSSMSPTLVFKEGRPVLAIGAAGGPTIITQTLLALLQFIDRGLPVDAALAQPRFHHQWRPDELKIERTFDPAVRAELRRRGHTLQEVAPFGACHAVSWSEARKTFEAAADPRTGGAAEAY